MLSDISYSYIIVHVVTLILLNVFPFIMNASSWKKAADLVAQVTPANPQVQAAAMAESQQLERLPLTGDEDGHVLSELQHNM